MIFLAQQHNNYGSRQYVPIARIAEALDIPFQFLKKIMQVLVEKGLLISQRSAKGGVALIREAENMSVFEVIQAIDGAEILISGCILEFPGCGNDKPCPLHHEWAVERKRLRTLFEATTLYSVAKDVDKGLTRLHLTGK